MAKEFFTNYSNQKHLYMMLDRLIQDCKYYAMTKFDRHLWAGNPQDHESAMREAYNKLSIKPEWCTEKQLEEYISMLK